jgi:hypothetical protein
VAKGSWWSRSAGPGVGAGAGGVSARVAAGAESVRMGGSARATPAAVTQAPMQVQWVCAESSAGAAGAVPVCACAIPASPALEGSAP